MDLTDGSKWLEAQYSVLGSMLISPEVVPQVMFETSASDYYGPCLTVYKAIRKLFEAKTPVDPVSVMGVLGDDYQDFLVQLMEVTPTAANIDLYISLCKDQARVSAIRDLARQITDADTSDKIRLLLEQASGLMVEKANLKITTMLDGLRDFSPRHTQKAEYLSWPIQELNDRIFVGPGDFIILGGYPSAGKSAWALQCAWLWASSCKVGFFSLETSSEKLFDRLMASVSGIPMDTLKRNVLSQEDWEKFGAASTEISSRNLEIIPAAGMTAADVRAVTMMRGYQVIIIDYLQLLQAPGENRVAQVTAISIALHTMAQYMGVAVVALSQLSRPPKQAGQKRSDPPGMSSLRESGQIEQDADLVLLLSLKDEEEPEGSRVMTAAKNKEGTRFRTLLDFDGRHQTFSKAKKSGETLDKYVADGKRARRKNAQAAQNPDQLAMLPPDAPVPF